MADLICDFCSAPNPVWMYANPQFTSASGALFIAGHFSACQICGLLLESGQIAELVDRSLVSRFLGPPDIRSDFITSMKAELYGVFSKVTRHRETLRPYT